MNIKHLKNMETTNNSLNIITSIVGMVLIYILSISAIAMSVTAAPYEANITTTSNVLHLQDANFVVQSIKYDPYPVNPGEWFDIWIKVENVGQDDAVNSQFELLSEYPFTIDNPIQKSGIIMGKVNAFKTLLPGEKTPSANQLVLKYRVKVADNAQEGTQTLKITTSTNGNNSKRTYDIPITVQKTKTDFDLVMQESNPRRTTFAISNTGDKSASAVTLSIKDAKLVNGAASAIIGTLNPGDFTSVGFSVLPNTKLNSITLVVSYTDTSGVRQSVEKIVPVKLIASDVNSGISSTKPEIIGESYEWVYGVIGLVLGFVIGGIFFGLRNKKRSSK